MGTKLIVLFCMIFCHIIDDFYLQGWLASAKQKEWWVKNAPESKYKYDYIAALIIHSFSWSFMIMLPLFIYILLLGGSWYPLVYIGNMCIHFYVDNLKANEKKINLIQDQLIHLVQIFVTWIMCIWR